MPPPPFRRTPAPGLVNPHHPPDHRGLRPRGRRCQVRHPALSVHVRQREGEEERTVLLARVAHVGRCRHPAGVEAVPAPEDAYFAVLHSASEAAVEVFVAGGGEAQALHRASDLAET